ncbi:hypothetical protein [Thermomonospora catenispora]|uniref:hypothetical protein n=1 Tax=Thermomonospora catenispora TaxID=2493090 RepID=UPI001375BB44|nr:hypothetical protein [Thermomonospora catenispora]
MANSNKMQRAKASAKGAQEYDELRSDQRADRAGQSMDQAEDALRGKAQRARDKARKAR